MTMTGNIIQVLVIRYNALNSIVQFISVPLCVINRCNYELWIFLLGIFKDIHYKKSPYVNKTNN